MTEAEYIENCPVSTAQKIIAGKWSIMIIYCLSKGTTRFGQLNKKLPMLTQATLTKQLRALEESGVVARTVYAEIPPKVEYALTPLGEKFLPVLCALSEWGQECRKQMALNKAGDKS